MRSRIKRYRGYSLVVILWMTGWNSHFLSAQTAASNFIAITPCRVVDTRGPAGDFGGPTMQGLTSRDFPILLSPCGIPSTALAYSFDVAVVPQGPLSYITVWPTGAPQPSTSNLNSPAGQVIANAVLVAAGANGSISIYVSNTTDLIVDITGYFIAEPPASTPSDPDPPDTDPPPGIAPGAQNTGIGFNALVLNTGSNNTAMGAYSLAGNTSGINNVAYGADSLLANVSGSANSAFGGQALANNQIANDNTAMGFSALWGNVVGANNTAVGFSALYTNAVGSSNVAIGWNTLYASTGSWNTGIGYQAGSQISNGSYNIMIGNAGMPADSNTIRIGTAAGQPGTGQTATYIAGIDATTVSGVQVLVNTSGQLGVASSSERFKEDIHDIGNASDELMLLRPVSFRYKQAFADGSKPLEYGLLGEEVAKVYPELVIYDRAGQVESLKYQELPALLLNEVQKQHKIIEELEARIAALEAQLAKEHASR